VRLGKSVVAVRHIPAGAVVQADMLTAKSPGDGIAANHLAELIGRVAAVEVAADTLLPSDALSWELSEKLTRDGVGSSA
jgi:N-acetylneuraminate synthase